jgi:hypothetical protein
LGRHRLVGNRIGLYKFGAQLQARTDAKELRPENGAMSTTFTKPRRRRLSCNRALVLDLLALQPARAYYPLERLFELGEVATLRQTAARRIAWPVLFMKAYAIVASRRGQLRQGFVRWPWSHVVECGENVAMLSINREFEGEDRICWGRFFEPERQTLVSLQDALERYQREPVDEIFKSQVQMSRLPGMLRRMIWRWNLSSAARKRAKRLGTFSMSTLAGQQTLNRHHPTLHTTSLTFGPVDERGRMLVTLICDHRVVDGYLGASALAELERELCGAIADELRGLADTSLAA